MAEQRAEREGREGGEELGPAQGQPGVIRKNSVSSERDQKAQPTAQPLRMNTGNRGQETEL